MGYSVLNEKSNFTSQELRQICVDNNFFTYGDTSEYARLFEMAKQEVELGRIVDWIWQHSDKDAYSLDYVQRAVATKYIELVTVCEIPETGCPMSIAVPLSDKEAKKFCDEGCSTTCRDFLIDFIYKTRADLILGQSKIEKPVGLFSEFKEVNNDR